MANYYAAARSNYFAVKDEAAFREWADRLGLTVLEPDHRDKTADGIRRLGIAPGNGGDSGGWPDSTYDADQDEVDEFDLTEELAPHLADDEVAVLMAVGNEALRYVTGRAVAVNSRGKIVSINLDTIYDAARELGPNITRAEY
jgi:hypothetical protein